MNEVRDPRSSAYSIVWLAALKIGVLTLVCLLEVLSASAQAKPTASSAGHALSTSAREDQTPLDELLDRARDALRMRRMAEAEKLSLSALQEAEKLGETSPKLADVLIFVAGVYHRKGELEKAVAFTERTLAIDEKTLGTDHPSVARDLNNLAMYYRQPNPAKAEKYTRRVVEIVEKSPDMDTANRIGLLNNAAAFYRYQGRKAEGRE